MLVALPVLVESAQCGSRQSGQCSEISAGIDLPGGLRGLRGLRFLVCAPPGVPF
jgi:hypothetical protein